MCCNNVLYSLSKYFFVNLYPFQHLIFPLTTVCAKDEEVVHSSLESNEPLYCHTYFIHTSTVIHITYFNQHVVIIQNSMVMSTHL